MNSRNILLSQYGRASSRPSPVNRMMAEFSEDFRPGFDINLGVGYVNENTIPGNDIQKALGHVLAHPEAHPIPLNYGGPSGSRSLLNAVKDYLLMNARTGLTKELLQRNRIIIGPNGATSLLESAASVISPGIVITSDPMYYIYCDYLSRCGFEVLAVPEDSEGISMGHLEKALAGLGERKKEIRFIYLVTVGNPTGTILTENRRRAIFAVALRLSAKLGHKVPLILDKAYEELIHDKNVPAPRSALTWDEAGLVYEIGTLSKVLAPALRIGYMVGRDGPFLQAMVQRTSDAGFSAPLINQEMASCLLRNNIHSQLRRVNKGYRQKALLMKGLIEKYLGPGLSKLQGGRAGFYYYLTFKNTDTTETSAFFRFLTRTTGTAAIDGAKSNRPRRVLYLPGQFCVHPNGSLAETGHRQLRLSYGYEEEGQIVEALKLMGQAAEYAACLN